MNFYISQLDENKKIIPIIEKYNVGLEIVQFSNPFILDNKEQFIKEYKREWGSLLDEINISIHGPFADLSAGSRDIEITKITSKRYNQAYEVVKEFNAKRIVYHNGYIPRLYTYTEWLQNTDVFWDKFFEDKNDDIIYHLENVLEWDYFLIKETIDRVNKINFNACLDLGHTNVYSKLSVEQWIEALGSKIGHLHVHNNYGEEDSHFGIEKGNVDVKKIIKLVEENNKDVSISLEIVNVDELKKSLEVLCEDGFISRR